MSTTARLSTALALPALMLAPAAAPHAQSYPAKPVRMIVPYPPGGATDIFARLVGAKLTEALGQPFVIEQRPGAAGVIGAEVVAKAAPDGYTVFIGQASNLAINQHLMKKLPYDPVRDFAPITRVAASPNLLVIHPSMPVHSIRDLVALAQARPGAINYASAGNGSPGHLAAEYFRKTAQIDVVHIPYKGATPAILDVIAGQVSYYFTSPIAAQPYVKAGRLRQIAVTSAKRFPPLPDVPSIAESGYKDIDIVSWWGLLAPAGTPPDVVGRLNAATVKLLDSAEMKERLASQGAVVVPETPAEFAAYIKAEIANWGKIVRASGARLD
jgi:tripartite-type tricarboxylate transporter receptor subunit TctC